MKKHILLFLLAIPFFAIVSCSDTNNTTKETDDSNELKLSFDGTEIHYSEDFNEEEVEILGQFLIEADFTDGSKKTVYISKSEDKYQFKMPVKEGYEKDEGFIDLVELFASQLSSSVFSGEKVEIVLCNNELETLKTVQMIEGINLGYNMRNFDGIDWQYDNNVTDIQIESLRNYLNEKGYLDNKIQQVIFLRDELWFHIQLYVAKEDYEDSGFKSKVKEMGQEIFDKVVFCETLQVDICNDLGLSQVTYFYNN
ncbi:MAG: hypothetical protein C0596_10390 [Marinilabiliales bacterium]|nr:MAG: hypothetical protein C0596_10390 [Marinilabiliales bacterium]